MASKCQKFQPNIFNKLKCQSCFGAKELHSAQALESNKATRKVSKCGYLFVSPDFDFSNPLDRGRRWQRRFFRLFDDGELTFCVDEDPDTIPQGTLDMNKCTEVKDAEKTTTHPNSLAIVIPNKTTYIKANSKEEIMWWQEVLSVFPKANQKPKNRRFTMPIFSNKENVQPLGPERKLPSVSSLGDGDATVTGRFEVEKVKAKEQPFSTYRGVRSMKHKTDKHYQEGLRKSSSLHDLSSGDQDKELTLGMGLASSKFLSRSGDRLDYVSGTSPGMDHVARVLADSNYNNPYFTFPRRSWQMLNTTSSSNPQATLSASSSASSTPASSSTQHTPQVNPSHIPVIRRRGSSDDKTTQASSTASASGVGTKPKTASERARLHRERSTSMKEFPSQFTLPKPEHGNTRMSMSGLDRLSSSSSSSGSSNRQSGGTTGTGQRNVYDLRNNETDEFKMAKSSELQAASRTRSQPSIATSNSQPSPAPSAAKYEDLMYMKKGWLIKQGSSDKDWKKHWFVLTGNCLRYYKDAKAEETNNLDGRIDLSTCFNISEVNIGRNYGFRIKSRNGEYILSAMTSGIRNNWLKAIRLVMDLQTSNKNTTSTESDASSSPRVVDDLDLNTDRLSASTGSRSSSESPKEVRKREHMKNIRRHYSDVSPGNIGKMFSVKDMSSGLGRVNLPPAIVGVVGSSSGQDKKSGSEDQVDSGTVSDQSESSAKKSDKASSSNEQDNYLSSSGNSLPLKRFVEGSDSVTEETVPQQQLTMESGSYPKRTIVSESKKEEDEKSRRAKSPSARVKEKSRTKVTRIPSPPLGMEELAYADDEQLSERDIQGIGTLEGQEQDLSPTSYHDGHFQTRTDDNTTSTEGSSPGGDSMLVELLETEVDSLKEQLETTHQELVKMHESNIDLKTKLQTAAREKDISQPQPQHGLESPIMRSLWNQQQSQASAQSSSANTDSSQVTTLRRQVKESRDTIQKQKTEIDQLRSKLDMSMSKLTGTERALSEALKDLKQEKDKFMKLSNDWNKKIRNLEGQLKDTNHKMERQKDSLTMKENECKRIESEIKTNHQKMREYEREILKLKAVEREYKELKERMDGMEKQTTSLKLEVKEKDTKCKNIESQYENHITELEQEFSRERDDMEQHLEDMKKKFMDAQQQSINTNIAGLLQEKDEIISQLEEKLIENEKKMLETNEELQAEIDANVDIQNGFDVLQREKSQLDSKLKDLEKLRVQLTTEKRKLEEENRSLVHHLEEYEKEALEISHQLDIEKETSFKLNKENEMLHEEVKNLHSDIELLEENFQIKEKELRQDLEGLQESGVKEMIENFILVESELSEVSNTVSHLQKQFKDYKSGQSIGQQSKLLDMGELLENIGKRCENLQDILTEGTSELTESKNSSVGVGRTREEFTKLQEKYDRAITEANNLRKEVSESKSHCEAIRNKNQELQDSIKHLDGNYKQKIKQVESKVDNLTLMVREVRAMPKISATSSPQKQKIQSIDLAGSLALSEEIEEQLNELEERVEFVDKILRTSDEGVAGISDVEDEDEEDSDGFMSSEEEDEEEESDEDSEGNSSQFLIGKLKQMKKQLEVTNNKIHEVTSDLTLNQSLLSTISNASSNMDEGLKKTLRKCEERIDSLTSRLSEKFKEAKFGGVMLETSSSENTIAFQYCLKEMRAKLVDVNNMVAEHETLDAKSLSIVHKKLMHLLEFLNCLQRFRQADYSLLGKVARQDSRAQSMLAERESRVRRSRLHFEEKLHIYADRLSVEAIILSQMAFLVQRYQMGDLYRDVLMKEICDANTVILELERKIDEARKLYSPGEQEGGHDLVSTYAAILAEKIVLEGQLASCVMAADNHKTDDTAVLTALHIADNPSILAMEVFLRSQVDSSINHQLHKASDLMDTSTGHIITRALVQGEITHALEQVKSKFSLPTDIRDVTDLLRRERKFSQEQLLSKHDVVCNSVEVYQAFVLSCLRYHLHHSQSQSSSLLESLCKKMSEAFHTQIKKFQETQQKCEDRDQNKCQHIISVLQSELDKALTNLKDISELGSVAPEDEDQVDLDVMSAEATVLQLADILIHCAVVRGTVLHINEMVNLGNFPEIPDASVFSSDSSHSAGQNEVTSQLGHTLISEASGKQALAAELKKFTPEGATSEEATKIVDILGIIPDTGIFNPESLGSYGENLMREALYQAQLTYMSYKMKLQHERDMRDIKFKLEAGQKVDLPSDSGKDAEGDIHASLSVFEEILETKFQDECEVLSILDKEMKQLQTVSAEAMSASNSQVFNQQLMTLISTFEHELSVAQERHDVHVDVLRQEVNNICMRVEKMTDEYEKEKEAIVSDCDEKIGTMQEEIDNMKEAHEEELEQVRQDIMTAVSAIRANEEQTEGEQYKDISRQILAQRDKFNGAVTEFQKKLSEANINLSISQELEEHVGQLQASFPIIHETPLPMPMSPPPIMSPPPVTPTPKIEEEETDAPLMDTLNATDENGTTLDRSQHDYELELLKREKEEALAEEVKTTKAALDAMRKAYDEELQEEKEKYREALKTMYTDDFLSEIRSRHEEEASKLREELKTVQMHYDSKTEDHKLLEDRLQNTKTEFETHIKHLNTSNERLNELVNEEIEKLKDFVQNKSMGRIPGNATIEEELYDAQIMVRMKDAELQKLRSQVRVLENNLERTTDEQRNSMTQYLQMYRKYQELETKYKQETTPHKESDEGQRGTNRSIRRTPSFHHRTRSPSPQTQGPVKKEEHHSRDSLRRRHIDAKDLKRSKSSPSLPFVFGNRLPSTSGLGKSSSKALKPMKATKS